MSAQKLVTVFGATGQQGSAVLRSLAANTSQPFALRALTRNPSSPAARALASSIPGLDVRRADGWDDAALASAFAGSWAVFANTNSNDAVFEGDEARTEEELGRRIVNAAVEAGVQVFVYSGLASAREATGGKVAVEAFDEKHAISRYALSHRGLPTTAIVSAGWYFENFTAREAAGVFGGFPYEPAADGALVYRCPRWGGREDVPYIGIADDYGDIVHGVLLEAERWGGAFVQAVSQIMAAEDVVAAFERSTGKRARYEEIAVEEFETYGVRGLENVKGMLRFCQESGGRYYGVETESATAAELKRRAAEACGKTGAETQLLTLEKFFAREFAGTR